MVSHRSEMKLIVATAAAVAATMVDQISVLLLHIKFENGLTCRRMCIENCCSHS